MKSFKLFFVLALAVTLSTSSCTVRLVDFTVISTKNAEIGANKLKGKRTEGKKSYFLGFGFNLKDALDVALENAGSNYDLLIDGVVNYKSFPFVVVVEVKGKAVKSADLVSELGQEGFENWCLNNNIFDPNTAKIKP